MKQLVYENLRMRIINGELAPGTKLREEEMSEEMNISRAPIREALNMLERDGFAQIIPRRGAVVTDISFEDIQNIWMIRELLEPTAARLSMPNVPTAEVSLVKEHLLKVLGDPSDFEAYMESDIEVHSLLSDYLDNRYLSDILKNLKDHSLRVRWNAEKQSESDGLEIVATATQEHLAIAEAFLKGDGDAVYDTVLQHIRESRKRMISRGGWQKN